MSFYPEPDSYSKRNNKFELELLNYATKFEVKRATGVIIPAFAKKADLTSLKIDVDKLDFEKIKHYSN